MAVEMSGRPRGSTRPVMSVVESGGSRSAPGAGGAPRAAAPLLAPLPAPLLPGGPDVLTWSAGAAAVPRRLSSDRSEDSGLRLSSAAARTRTERAAGSRLNGVRHPGGAAPRTWGRSMAKIAATGTQRAFRGQEELLTVCVQLRPHNSIHCVQLNSTVAGGAAQALRGGRGDGALGAAHRRRSVQHAVLRARRLVPAAADAAPLLPACMSLAVHPRGAGSRHCCRSAMRAPS